MEYDIAFLSILIQPDKEEEVRKKSSRLMEDAAIAWQNHIIRGIEENIDEAIKLINTMPVHAYPGGYKDAFIKRSKFAHCNGAEDINIGFCNIKIIKRMFRHIPIISEVEKWANDDSGRKKVLIAYTLFHEFTYTIRKIKVMHPDIVTVSIVVDLPKFVATSRKKVSFLSKIYEGWSSYQSNRNIPHVDGFAVITKQMAEKLCPEKPFVVIEGICTDLFPAIHRDNKGKIKIIYAGLLLEKFGVIKLLDAFSLIDELDFQLLICGGGEAENQIVERARIDKRIQYLGQLKREEVLEVMSSCDVIVNPRENVGEFTKYSFPSKNLEALSSGIPFVGYKLDGIPDEYDKYINYPENDTVQALANEIISVGKLCAIEAKHKAESAQKWVLGSKSCDQQGKKIIALIERITEKE